MSDPTIHAPSPFEPTQIDIDMQAFIKEQEAKFAAEETKNEENPEGSQASDGTNPQVEAKTTSESQNTVDDPASRKESGQDRGLGRLVEREVALRSRESALEARERALVDVEKRIKTLESRALPEDLAAKWEYEPEAAMRAMGLDPDMIVRQVIASKLGKDAPPEVQNTLESARVKKQIDELRHQLAEHQRMMAAQTFVAQVQSGAREFMGGEGLNATPTVATVAKTNPARVFQEIMEEISKDAAARAHAEPGGDVLPYAEAAKRVEARWSEFKALVSPGITTPAPAATAKASTTPAETAREAPSKSSTTKPPERPIAPWLQKTDLEEEGIRAAMVEFRKHQA